MNPGDIVLVSNRYEVQMCAIDCGAGAIVVCCGSAVPRTILARAQEKGCIVITTPFDTYAAARLISTAAPVRHFMRSKNLLEFSVNTAVEDAARSWPMCATAISPSWMPMANIAVSSAAVIC